MKKVIDRKIYDTETAEPIASEHWGCNGDFKAWDETLYRTSRGSWFLYGVGGPMTKWSEPAPGGGTSGGSDIVPLTEKQAFEWCQRHQKLSMIEMYFSDFVELA